MYCTVKQLNSTKSVLYKTLKLSHTCSLPVYCACKWSTLVHCTCTWSRYTSTLYLYMKYTGTLYLYMKYTGTLYLYTWSTPVHYLYMKYTGTLYLYTWSTLVHCNCKWSTLVHCTCTWSTLVGVWSTAGRAGRVAGWALLGGGQVETILTTCTVPFNQYLHVQYYINISLYQNAYKHIPLFEQYEEQVWLQWCSIVPVLVSS